MSDLFNEDYLVSSPSYSDVMDSSVIPWLQAREKASTVSGYENRPLYCVSCSADNPAGTVLIVPEQLSHETERRLCVLGGDSISLRAEVSATSASSSPRRRTLAL